MMMLILWTNNNKSTKINWYIPVLCSTFLPSSPFFFWEKKPRGSDKDRWNCPLDPLPEVDVFQAVTGKEVSPNVTNNKPFKGPGHV